MLRKWFKGRGPTDQAARPKAPDYETCKRVAQSGSGKERAALAASAEVAPELLYYFASDDEVRVRRAVAANKDTPVQADIILANDNNDDVRVALATKVARLLPDLRPDQNEKVASMAFEVLETLAKDQLTQVRATVAESVKNLDTVPKSVIELLSADPEEKVSSPVLEFSPLLDDDDLLGLIVGGLRQARLAAVARRTRMSGSLADAIAATKDVAAIPNLLKNENATISEAAFDDLVAEVENEPVWGDLIARRESVPGATLSKLARFAGKHVLDLLKARTDLPPAVRTEINAMAADAKPTAAETKAAEAETAAPAQSKTEEIEQRVAKMAAEGKLTPKAVMKAVDQGDIEFVSIALATLGDIKAPEVRKIFSHQSAKSVLALCWKCGLGMKEAEKLQRITANIPYAKQMRATPDGGFPLSEDELSWQADLVFSA